MALALAIGSLCFAFVLAMGLNRLALRSWRRSEGLHWAERARLLNPARKSASLNHWLIPVNLGIFSYSLCPEYSCLYAVLPSFVGVSLANYFMSREIFPELNFKSWLHLFAAALIIFFIGWVVLFVAIIEMPDNFGWKTWVFAGTVFLLLLALNFGLGIRILKWFRLIEPATPHLQSLVNEVSDKMGVPVRATWILSAQLSNAAAFPQTKQLVFTSKLLETCADDEIKSFCAHELGHLNESRKVLFMRLLVSMAFVPLIFISPISSFGDNGVTANWVLIITVLLFWLAGIRLQRRMEKRADKIALENQDEAAVYARALERLYKTNQIPAVMPKRSNKIHPDLYDRMIAAGVTPDFPKPKPAKGLCWTTYLMFVSLFVIPYAIYIVRLCIYHWQLQAG